LRKTRRFLSGSFGLGELAALPTRDFAVFEKKVVRWIDQIVRDGE